MNNCQDLLEEFPYIETKVTRERLVKETAYYLYWHMVCQEFGEERANAVSNLTYQDKDLRKEFHAEGAETSTRDFTYLLDLI